MTKIIKIEKCRHCPNHTHKGGFGQVAYIPVCSLANKEQPWKLISDGRMAVAHQTVDIPEWCPLETYKEPV